mmetsp:Transcript_7860/g.19438  ORF Transcript_7860/g.19438 Transcript_7860/m.19438 type:complete len:201 (+) Transcript_7860:535-1137(+)
MCRRQVSGAVPGQRGARREVDPHAAVVTLVVCTPGFALLSLCHLLFLLFRNAGHPFQCVLRSLVSARSAKVSTIRVRIFLFASICREVRHCHRRQLLHWRRRSVLLGCGNAPTYGRPQRAEELFADGLPCILIGTDSVAHEGANQLAKVVRTVRGFFFQQPHDVLGDFVTRAAAIGPADGSPDGLCDLRSCWHGAMLQLS